MTRDRTVGTILAFALGAGVGAAAALLLAPRTGEELRGNIVAGAAEGARHARGIGKGVKRKAQRIASQAHDTVEETLQAGQDAYSQAKRT